MIAAIFLATNSIGAIPLAVALLIKSISTPGILKQFAESHNDLNSIGLSPVTVFVSLMIPFIVGLLVFILLVKPLHNRTFKKVINGTSKIRWNRFFISGFVWLILSALYLFICLKTNPSNFKINNVTITFLTISVLSIIFIPFQAAFEEIIFRGYLMQGFAVIFRNRWLPLIITSVLFGLLHALNPEVKAFGFFTMIPQYIVFGLIFGIVTIFDDGIEATMGAHAANNAFLCIMVTNKSSALQTPALFEQNQIHPWTEFAALIVTGIVFIFILRMIFKWESRSLLFRKIP